MGCVASAESDEDEEQALKGTSKTETLAERKKKSKARRKGSKSLVHNLVHEEFDRDIRELYDVDDDVLLGEGIQGIVRTVVHKETGMKYAMKTVPLGAGKNSRAMVQLRSELDLIRRLDHPNIVRLQQVFETEDSLYLVMDLCTGGDMMARWERNRKLRYTETEAALTVKKIVNAIRYCHEHRVVHRDIKLENLLWEHPGDDAEPQLVDFGLGVTFADDSDTFREDVGTLYYVAPEVLGRKYTKACDCWSIGVIAYMLLSGMPPFVAPTDDGIKLKIRWTKPGFPKERWEKISEEAKDFIKKMLIKDPSKRMTADEASAHPWLAKARARPARDSNGAPPLAQMERAETEEEIDGSREASEPLDPELIRRLGKFQLHGKLERVALEVIAYSLSPEEKRKLRGEFQKVDVEGKGMISPLDLQKALNASGDYNPEQVERLFKHIDVDHNGSIGFNEFLAASLDETHVKDENLRMAFNRLDDDQSGKVTMDDLQHFTGATVDDQTLEDQITDDDLREALLNSEDDGICYEMVRLGITQDMPFIVLKRIVPAATKHVPFRKAMVKTFSKADLEDPGVLRTIVRVASKMSIDELAEATGESKKDAGAFIRVSQRIVDSRDKGTGATTAPNGEEPPSNVGERASADVGNAGAVESGTVAGEASGIENEPPQF